jgi:hypothetical protein
MDKDPSDPGIDLRIVQLCEEGMVRATWPWIHLDFHLPSSEWLYTVADEGPQEVRAHQHTS